MNGAANERLSITRFQIHLDICPLKSCNVPVVSEFPVLYACYCKVDILLEITAIEDHLLLWYQSLNCLLQLNLESLAAPVAAVVRFVVFVLGRVCTWVQICSFHHAFYLLSQLRWRKYEKDRFSLKCRYQKIFIISVVLTKLSSSR